MDALDDVDVINSSVEDGCGRLIEVDPMGQMWLNDLLCPGRMEI